MHLLIALLQWLGRVLLREVRESGAYWIRAAAWLRAGPIARALARPDRPTFGWMTVHPALARSGVPPGYHGSRVGPPFPPGRARRARRVRGADLRPARPPMPSGSTDPPKSAWPLWA